MKGGWIGNVLSVDLTKQTVTRENLDPEMAKKYVGGIGLGIKIVYDEVQPGMDAFDEATPLVFVTGPMTGTSAISSGAYGIVTKSPLVPTMMTQGTANGFFGLRLKQAGFDVVIIRGKSEKPVYLWINDGEAELRDASEVWGLNVGETEARLKEKVDQKSASVSCIGIAGENMVRYAAVCSDFGHIVASGGIGAVMGSKKLKAVVAYGTQKVPIYDEQKLKEVCDEWRTRIKESEVAMGLKAYGTGGSLGMLHNIGDVPTKNFTTNLNEEIDNLTGFFIRENFQTKVKPCYKCPINHVHCIQFTEGPYEGLEVEEPEYEGICATGTNIGVGDAASMLYLHHLVDNYGMDIKTLTYIISLCMECYEKGLLSKEQLDGLDLTWGNVEAVEKLLGKISRREGIGNVLAENIKTIAEYIGGDAPNMAVHIRGAGIHLHDIRSLWGFGLSHVISNFPSTMDGVGADLGPDPEFGYHGIQDPLSSEGHAEAQKICDNKDYFGDCGILCSYNVGRTEVPTELVIRGLNAITGEDYTTDEIWKSMYAIRNLARAFNVRHGLTPEDDWPSERILMTPVDGPIEGISWRPYLKDMVLEFYRLMGWDEKTGKPKKETLKDLGLDFVIKDIWN